MNRSAKDGARSSWHWGSEGVLPYPSQQGVYGRHGAEDLDVTEGKARSVSGWQRDRRAYKSEDEVGSEALRVVGQPNSTRSRVKARGPRKRRPAGPGKAAGKGGRRETVSK
jgi:hypothetical protein